MRVPSPRTRLPWVAAVRFAWTLPTNVVGHLAGLAATRSRPRRIGSAAARAWLYTLPSGSRLWPPGAVAIGDAIICAPEFLGDGARRRMVLAHELSHVRQHHWLGPCYLPLHALAQVASAALHLFRPRAGSAPQYAYNPLEERFLCVPFSAIAGFGAGRTGSAAGTPAGAAAAAAGDVAAAASAGAGSAPADVAEAVFAAFGV